MISKSQIRQATVQLLYGVGTDASGEVSDERLESLWPILLEKQTSAYHKAKVKAIKHLTRDYGSKFQALKTDLSDFLDRIKNTTDTDRIKDALSDILDREKAFHLSLFGIAAIKKGDPDFQNDEISREFQKIADINQTLIQLIERFLTLLNDFPQYARQIEKLVKSIKKLKEIHSQILYLDRPELCENKAEFSNVISIKEDMETLKKESSSLFRLVVSKITQLDQIISEVVENYSNDRLSLIERAIIRISIYEMLYGEKLPVPIVISEAINLADFYSVTEAPRFINGILAAVASKYRNDEPVA